MEITMKETSRVEAVDEVGGFAFYRGYQKEGPRTGKRANGAVTQGGRFYMERN